VPGLQVRLPLLFSEGVGKGRLSLNEFVALTATNHARMYGLAARKGTIAVGADADLALWEPEKKVTLTAAMMKDNVGYTPYEGMTVTGWPTTVISRGRIAVESGELKVGRGSGEFVPRGVPEPVATVRPSSGGAGLLRGLLGERR
jgi:dihydropyrimidinase